LNTSFQNGVFTEKLKEGRTQGFHRIRYARGVDLEGKHPKDVFPRPSIMNHHEVVLKSRPHRKYENSQERRKRKESKRGGKR